MAQILDKVPVAHDYLCDTSYIEPFGHIREFGKLKMKRIVPDSLDLHLNEGIEIYYVRETVLLQVPGKNMAVLRGFWI